MAWISPTGSTGSGFKTRTYAYDGDENTYTAAGVKYEDYGTWYCNLVLTFDEAFLCDKLRVKISRSNSDIKNSKIEVYSDSAYTQIYIGSPSINPSLVTRYLPSQMTISRVRISFYFGGNSNPLGTQSSRIYEVYANTLVAPTVTTDVEPTANDHNSATLAGNVTADNDEAITERGIEYKVGESGDPSIVSETDDDFDTGVFTLSVTGLTNSTTYYYRAYAVNSSGTGYGEWISFTTDNVAPVVETLTCTNIGTTSVTANGNITNKGGATVITRGFCYKEGTTGDPTTADDTQSEGAGAGDYALGTYSLSITGLTPSTDYRIRAYAVNSVGTAYGETISLSGYSFTENADTYFANFWDKCYIVNGVDNMVKYDGDLVSSVGITPPTAAPTGVAGGADGSLGTGDYVYAYTYVDRDGYEGNASAVSAAVTVGAGEKVTLTIANSSDPKVVSKNIYRSQVNDTELYYEGAVSDNTTTTFTSSIADTALGSLLHTDHDAPPSGAQLIMKKGNRIFLANDDDLVVSQLSDVEYFPPAWFIKNALRQNITGMLEQFSYLPVMTENSVERLSGTDEDNYEIINTYSRKGCYATRSLVSCDNLLVYLSDDGIYYFDGDIAGTFSHKLNEYIKDNINPTYISKAAAIYYNGLYMLSYPKGTSTVNSETVYIDLINKTTGVYDYAFSCYSLWNRMGDGNQLYGGDPSTGQVYRIDNDYTSDADNAPIEGYDESEYIDFGFPERYKQFYHIYIKVKSTDATDLTMFYTLDDNDEEEEAVTIEANTEKWYKIDLTGGGQRARAIKLRPYVKDTSDVIFTGYMIIFEPEAEEYS